jgi:hypothetical protein
VDCTADTCDDTFGCTHEADDTACHDGVSCTEDSCDDLLGCIYEPDDDDCDDGIDCTEDSCDRTLGCVNEPDDKECDDNVDCTKDICDPSHGCQNIPVDDRCNPGCLENGKCDKYNGCQGATPDHKKCEKRDCAQRLCNEDGKCGYMPTGNCGAPGQAPCGQGQECKNCKCEDIVDEGGGDDD